jgi:hypothetical protein
MGLSDKKALLLLKAIVFLHHDFTEDEMRLLNETAKELNAIQDLKWVMDFVNEDVYTAYERTRAYLKKSLEGEENDKKVAYLFEVWQATSQKGYVTEMEAMSMIKLARDWSVERDFIQLVRNK